MGVWLEFCLKLQLDDVVTANLERPPSAKMWGAASIAMVHADRMKTMSCAPASATLALMVVSTRLPLVDCC